MGNPGNNENYYAILGVPFDASPEEIRRAFHAAAKRFHPDASKEVDAADQFLMVKEAYEALSDPATRAAYDAGLSRPETTEAIRLQTLVSRNRIIRAEEAQLVYLMIQLDAPEATAEKAVLPVNVCLVIDSSTSMRGTRMDMVKGAVRRILKQLNPQDFLSIVTFSDRAEVVLEPVRPFDLAHTQARVSLIQPGGGTELSYGLREGHRMLSRKKSQAATSRMIVLTDGQTYGDEEICLAFAEKCRADGITISALGIGEEWNEIFLERLAAKTGGASMYAAYARDVVRFLERVFTSLVGLAANNIRLEWDSDETLYSVRAVFRARPEPAVLEPVFPVSLGALRRAETLECLLEVMIPDSSDLAQQELVLSGSLLYDMPDRAIPSFRLRFHSKLKVLSPDEEAPPAADPPAELVNALQRWTMYRIQERAREDVMNGDYLTATRRLRHLATNMLTSGETELASKIMKEAGRLEAGGGTVRRLDKSIMYGTKSLGLTDS